MSYKNDVLSVLEKNYCVKHPRFPEFRFSTGFFFVVPLLCLHNTLITTKFDILKYIKKIFKISIQCIFNAHQRAAHKN